MATVVVGGSTSSAHSVEETRTGPSNSPVAPRRVALLRKTAPARTVYGAHRTIEMNDQEVVEALLGKFQGASFVREWLSLCYSKKKSIRGVLGMHILRSWQRATLAGHYTGVGGAIIFCGHDAQDKSARARHDVHFRGRCIEDHSIRSTRRGCCFDWLRRSTARALGTSSQDKEPSVILRDPAVFLTYNFPAGCLDRATIPSVTDAYTVDDVAVAIANHAFVLKLHDDVQTLVSGLQAAQTVSKYAASLEICVKTWYTEKIVRVHLHLWAKLPKKAIRASTLCINGVPGHVSEFIHCHMSISENSRSALRYWAACYYCLVPKIGQVATLSNVERNHDFFPNESWVFALVAASKITVDTARQEFLMQVRGSDRNIQTLEFVEQQKRSFGLSRCANAMKYCSALYKNRFDVWLRWKSGCVHLRRCGTDILF